MERNNGTDRKMQKVVDRGADRQREKYQQIHRYKQADQQKGHSETKTQTQIEVQRDRQDRQKQKERHTNGEKQTQIQKDIGKE